MTDDATMPQDDSLDIQPWPVIELIGRAVTLATVARRGMLEVDDERDAFDVETDRFDLSTWSRTELQNWITDDELRLLNASVGELSDDDLTVCDDALIGATAIAWALRAVDVPRLPLPDLDELNERALAWAPQPWEKVRSMQSRVRLRSDEDLAAERERWELWYWRATDAEEDAAALADVVDELRETDLIPLADGDFADDNGTPFSRMSDEERDDVLWLAELRLRALNWTCGIGESWESAPLYPDE